MTTKREQILAALFAALATIPGGVVVLRNEVLPTRIPRAGLVILRDGDPGEPEITLSPLTYHWEHRAEVELFVDGKSGREAAFDALCEAVGQCLAGDRTLGGRCDWIEAGAPAPVDLPVDGASTIKAAVLFVTLHYASGDALA